jgi:hypothetical protein
MRPLLAIFAVVFLAIAIGCSWIPKNTPETPRSSAPIPQVSAANLVDYLDTRASRLQSISGKVVLTARTQGLLGREGGLSFTLHGNLAAGQPRYFRMTGENGMTGKVVDLGSNIEQFWVYVNPPTQKPTYVFASHSDFEKGIAKMPGGIPFEPDWVMQALGMHIFPKSKDINYETKINSSDRTYTLSWQSKTPTGVAIRKEVVFDVEEAHDGRPQVKKHQIIDSKTNKAICSAEVKRVQTVAIGGRDPQSTPLNVQYPIQVVLRWEIQKFELDLELEAVRVNQPFQDDDLRRLFTRPDFAGTQAFDLAKYEFTIK